VGRKVKSLYFKKFQILKGLCKVLNVKDSTLDTYVIGNAQRPILSYGVKGQKSARRSYLYMEALTKFEKEAKELDLTEAYKRARPSFTGKLERNFIILKDNIDEDVEMASGSNTEPIGQKSN
jgi:hypothetical protein